MKTTYIVLYVKNARIASVENTQENLDYLAERFYLSLMQKDITGTLHYNVLSPKRKRSIKYTIAK